MTNQISTSITFFKNILIALSLLLGGTASAQCFVNNGNTTYGFSPVSDSIPCVVQGQAYDYSMSFKGYQSINFQGNLITVDSTRIDTIGNLPCGISWATNKTNRNTFAPYESGCIRFWGTSNSPIGQYHLHIVFTLFIAGGVPITYDMNRIGGRVDFRVNNGSTCPGVDTTHASQTGCTANSVSPSSMWPGDADNDGTATEGDVLSVGLAYGIHGAPRPAASVSWVEQYSYAWITSHGINDRYADCDGNGIVNFDDTTVISTNYFSHHNKTENSNAGPNDPILMVVPTKDTVILGDSVYFDIIAGTQSLPVNGLYGIALNTGIFIPQVQDFSHQLNTTGSWLGSAGTNLFTYHKFGYLPVRDVVCRYDHQNASGYGKIAQLSFKTFPSLHDSASVTYQITPQVIRAVNANGDTVNFNIQTTSITFVDTAFNVGINETILSGKISLYPNPNSGKFILTINQPTQQLKIELLNIQGQQLYSEQLKEQSSLKKELDFGGIAKGIYLLKISTENGVAMKRVVVE